MLEAFGGRKSFQEGDRSSLKGKGVGHEVCLERMLKSYTHRPERQLNALKKRRCRASKAVSGMQGIYVFIGRCRQPPWRC